MTSENVLSFLRTEINIMKDGLTLLPLINLHHRQLQGREISEAREEHSELGDNGLYFSMTRARRVVGYVRDTLPLPDLF